MTKRQNKQVSEFRKAAAKHGVEVGDFMFQRLAEWRAEIEKLRQELPRGGPGSMKARELYIREAAAYMAFEKELLPYQFRKMGNITFNDDDGQPSEILIRWAGEKS